MRPPHRDGCLSLALLVAGALILGAAGTALSLLLREALRHWSHP